MDSHIGNIKSCKNGNKYKFLYKYYKKYVEEYHGKAYIFEIWEKGKENDDKFSFRLKIMGDNDLKIVDLYPDANKYYLGKGISIHIIIEAKSIFRKRIISSSNKYPTFPGESRSNDASKKVWKRLVCLGKASYDRENDYFYTL